LIINCDVSYSGGVKAAELILNRLNNKPIERKHIILESELIARDYT